MLAKLKMNKTIQQNMIKPLLNRLSLVLLMWVVSMGAFAQSVTLDPSPKIVCFNGTTGTLELTVLLNGVNRADVKSYDLDLGDGSKVSITTGSPVGNFYIHNYAAPGAYKIQVTAKFTNRGDLTYEYWDTVYARPVVNWNLTSFDSQCFKANNYVFGDLSTQAPAPSTPIASRYWVWGDGSEEAMPTPGGSSINHIYPIGGRRNSVTLRVTDQLGCINSQQKFVYVAPNIDAKFQVVGVPRCDTTPYIFVNKTAIPIGQVGRFRWDFGDGTSYTSRNPPIPADIAFWTSFTHNYVRGGIFAPKLFVQHRFFNCSDSFDYNLSGDVLPENIVIQYDVRSRRTVQNDTIADSVCFMNRNTASVCLYNQYPLQGINAQLQLLWDFADPNANPPGSDKKLNEVSPCYKYQGLGQYFPTLTVFCPGKPAKTVNFWSRIDTVNDVMRYNSPTFPPVANPRLNTINGYIFAPRPGNTAPDSISLHRFIPDGVGAATNITGVNNSMGTFISPNHNLQPGNTIKFTSIGAVTGIDTLTRYTLIFASGDEFALSATVGGPQVTFNYPGGNLPIYRWLKPDRDSIVSYWKFFQNDTLKRNMKITRAQLFGYGINILGPAVSIEAPPVPIVINKFLKNQCGPSFPVEFTNASSIYQSNHLYKKWDFGDNFAPACTSFSVANDLMGGPPYTNAQDMYNRTEPRFWANGQLYPGRVNCKFSHDTLPIHGYENWATVLRWHKFGHDFPPYDTTRWTTDPNLVTWNPGNPNGKRLVNPMDTLLWNKPMFSSGSAQARIDTIAMWPADLDPQTQITLNNDIPDPFANLKGFYKFTIPSGSIIRPTNAFITPIMTDKLPDGSSRRYRGTDLLPGSSKTLYDYAFERRIQQCYTVRLFMKDSVNNQSADPVRNLLRINMVGNTISIPEYHDGILLQTLRYTEGINIVNNKFFFRGPDSITVQQDGAGKFVLVEEDYGYVDEWDCGGTSTVQLPLMNPDAFGLGKDGDECPGLRSQNGGNPTFVFDRSGGSPGLAPTCGARTFLLINYDSFADRNDPNPLWNGQNTRCMLDAFVDFSGTSPMTGTTTTPGGYNMPAFYNGPNWNPNLIWQSPNGARNVTHYVPGNTPVQYSNLPKDPRGFVTVGIITGNGYASPTSNLPGCTSDTVWYHNFFHFITLDANFTYDRFDTSKFFPVIGPGNNLVYVTNPNYREPYCYLHGKSFYPSYPEKTNKIFGNLNTVKQDFVKSDAWVWGDDYATVDSFYTNAEDTFVAVERKNQPGVFDTLQYDAHTWPLGRIRFEYNVQTLPWTIISATHIPIGIRILDSTRWDTVWRCDDPLRAMAPQAINRVNIRIDSAFLMEPVPHTYIQSSWDMKVAAGGGSFTRRNDITPIIHVMTTTTNCQNIAQRQIVIGVIDTFLIRDSKNNYDTTFCIGETVLFKDSIRYWYPKSSGIYNPFRPLSVGEVEYVDIDFHGFAMRGYPVDTMKLYVNPTKYFVVPSTGTCPVAWVSTPVTIAGTGTALLCQKIDTFYHERIYWDFQSDGVIDKHGKNPTFQFNDPGRFKVSMITRDSLGYWDTCFQFVNVVKPNARFTSKGVFLCSDTVKFNDASFVDDWCFQNYGFSCDRFKERRWWFGDYGYGKDEYRSIEVNPTYDYRKNGWYAVRLVVETEQGCQDTLTEKIFIAGPRPRIKLLNDTLGCVPYTLRIVSYPDDSAGFSATRSTLINSGIPFEPPKLALNNPDTVTFVYTQEGTYYVNAVGYDASSPGASSCPPVIIPDTVGGTERPIKIYVKNPYNVGLFTPDTAVCVGEPFELKNRSQHDTITKYRLYNYNADYSYVNDTLFKTSLPQDTSFNFYFKNKGVYHLVLHSTRFLTGSPECENKDTITMRALLSKADLKAEVILLPKYYVTNLSDSTEAVKYIWRVTRNKDNSVFKEVTVNGNDDPNFNLGELNFGNDTGDFTICIWAYTAEPDACIDSACVVVNNAFVTDITIPNVFTPNGDNKNDFFKIDIKGEELYDLKIYNRWGGQVFESTNSTNIWNGKVNNSGADCPDGTYYFILTYRLRGKTEQTVRGSITLIRE
jgi:gliding motility-associated-like protein